MAHSIETLTEKLFEVKIDDPQPFDRIYVLISTLIEVTQKMEELKRDFDEMKAARDNALADAESFRQIETVIRNWRKAPPEMTDTDAFFQIVSVVTRNAANPVVKSSGLDLSQVDQTLTIARNIFRKQLSRGDYISPSEQVTGYVLGTLELLADLLRKEKP